MQSHAAGECDEDYLKMNSPQILAPLGNSQPAGIDMTKSSMGLDAGNHKDSSAISNRHLTGKGVQGARNPSLPQQYTPQNIDAAVTPLLGMRNAQAALMNSGMQTSAGMSGPEHYAPSSLFSYAGAGAPPHSISLTSGFGTPNLSAWPGGASMGSPLWSFPSPALPGPTPNFYHVQFPHTYQSSGTGMTDQQHQQTRPTKHGGEHFMSPVSHPMLRERVGGFGDVGSPSDAVLGNTSAQFASQRSQQQGASLPQSQPQALLSSQLTMATGILSPSSFDPWTPAFGTSHALDQSTPAFHGTPAGHEALLLQRERKRREFLSLSRECALAPQQPDGPVESQSAEPQAQGLAVNAPIRSGAAPVSWKISSKNDGSSASGLPARRHSDAETGSAGAPDGSGLSAQNSVSCETCLETFRYRSRLLYHMCHQHGDTSLFPCDACESAFRRPSELRKHVACVHAKHRPFRCDECEAGFYFRKDLRKHGLTVHEKSKKRKCGNCGVMYSGREEFRVHSEGLCRDSKRNERPARPVGPS
ncbi:Zinc finger and SCAN domain-containing protein 5B [Porphyridium purpureum]|uniref:Zinc finger and SCAN domain-containing protein 5B n=1 Tax=Porphyridium purpureum TaxID=35688 RepID=A0A5J4Z5I9_PORPP|nr:Zinc finger and SCAN domain-containing protein 5B [Porphyridium purpureum]|eukprot:POR6583..scf295_1